jgi:hypothetical protein
MTRFGDREIGNVVRDDSIAAADNNSGLTLLHEDIGARPFVTFAWEVTDGDATITFEGRWELEDGTMSGWKEIDQLNTADADVDRDGFSENPWLSFDECRMVSTDTAVGLTFIIAPTR